MNGLMPRDAPPFILFATCLAGIFGFMAVLTFALKALEPKLEEFKKRGEGSKGPGYDADSIFLNSSYDKIRGTSNRLLLALWTCLLMILFHIIFCHIFLFSDSFELSGGRGLLILAIDLFIVATLCIVVVICLKLVTFIRELISFVFGSLRLKQGFGEETPPDLAEGKS